MRPLITIAAAGAVAVAAVAGAEARPAPLTSVHVRTCQLSASPSDRAATFTSTMNAVPGTDRMLMRFRLRERTPGLRISPVHSHALSTWRKSHRGVQSFTYSQTVDGLSPSSVYWMAIDYRWLDASGNVIRSLTRFSGACSEVGPLNNLQLAAVSAHQGADSSTVLYDFAVENTGHVATGSARARLFVDSGRASTTTIDTIAPGTTQTIELAGPACISGVRLAIQHDGDPRRGVLSARCPAVQ